MVVVLHLQSHFPRAKEVTACRLTLTERAVMNGFLRQFITNVATLEVIHATLCPSYLSPTRAHSVAPHAQSFLHFVLVWGRILVLGLHPGVSSPRTQHGCSHPNTVPQNWGKEVDSQVVDATPP